MEAELADWLREQPEPRIVVKDPHAAWLVGTWAAASRTAGRDLRLLTAIRHPAEVVGSQDLTWGHAGDDDDAPGQGDLQRRRLAQRRARHRARLGRDLPRSFIRYSELIEDWRSALAGSRPSWAWTSAPTRAAGHGLDEWLDPALRRSQLSWGDIVVPTWLRDLAEDAWGQLNRLVGDPQDAAATARLDEIRADYDARYAEAVALTLDEARHRERLGARNAAAKFRPRVQRHKRRAERGRGRADATPRGLMGRCFAGCASRPQVIEPVEMSAAGAPA